MPDRLYPRPRRVERIGGASPAPGRLEISTGTDGSPLERVVDRLERSPARGDAEAVVAPARLRIITDRPADESYEMTWSGDGLELRAGGPHGLFHAATTFDQWVRCHPGTAVPHVHVDDAPALRHRGVMLDISRDKVPTQETLYGLVDRLADWKINQLQLYNEHTFAYAGHEAVWRDASPMTADEVEALDAYCRDRFIELVPNQNSLGHFHRWLVHEPYRRLAECPEGLEHPFSSNPEPFSLCPVDPDVPRLLAELYDQLLPHFESPLLNVGLDESFDIGRGRSADAVAESGAGRVYLDFVRTVHRLAAERGHRIQLWGDIILGHPDLIDELPEDVVVLNWGYEADHPFAEEAARFAASGREFYLCPGTSSWNSFTGRSGNALENLASAARQAAAHGATGVLITDWGDFGHLQPTSISLLGLLAGACFAWDPRSAEEGAAFDVAGGLDRWAFDRADAGLGAAVQRLGDTYLAAGGRPKNGTPPFFQLLFPKTALDHSRFTGVELRGLRRTIEQIDEARRDIAASQPKSADAQALLSELEWAARMSRLGTDLLAERLDGERSVEALASGVRRRLLSQLDELTAEHASIWALRNRPGGRADSIGRLAPLGAALNR